jgi:hypothetical protein
MLIGKDELSTELDMEATFWHCALEYDIALEENVEVPA